MESKPLLNNMDIRQQSIRFLNDLVHKINVVHIIASIAVINLGAMILDEMGYWYYFYNLVTQLEWLFAIYVIYHFYKKYPKKDFCTSAVLSGFFGLSVSNIFFAIRSTILYLLYLKEGVDFAEEKINEPHLVYKLIYTFTAIIISLIIYAKLLTQINKTKITMSNLVKGVIVGIAVLFLIFFPWDCSGDKESTETKVTVTERQVEIPEVKGGFESPKQFEENPGQPDTIKVTEKVYISTPNKIDKQLLAQYNSAKDSIEKLHLYVKSIQEKSYTTDYSDDNLTLTVDTKVRGELLEQKPKYKIHKQTVTVRDTLKETTTTKVKKDNFGTVIGGGIMKEFNTENYKGEVNAGVRVGKFTILGSVNTNSQGGIKLLYEL